MFTLPRLLRFIIITTGLHLLIFFVLRLGLYGYFNTATDPIQTSELIQAFYLGFKFDLRLSLFMLLPLMLFGGIRIFSPFEHDYIRRFWLFLQASLFTIIILIYFVNFAYFSYLHKPLDASAARFLQNFGISMEMVWSTYPIIWLSLLVAILTAIYVFVLNKIILNLSVVIVPKQTRKRKLSVGVMSFFIIVFAMYGKMSYYPLRWSDAFFSTHNFAPTVAMNPVLYLLNTLKNRDVSFNKETVKKYYPQVAAYLGVKNPDIESLNFARQINPSKRFKTAPNIVMVILESFSSYKMGIFNNPLDATPQLDNLAKNGIFFDRFYTPSTGTARSVWAAITSIPDIEKNKTSTRNPLIVKQNTLINAFSNYEKLYFIGGSASWGNIRGLLSSNIPGLKIFEEGMFTAPRMDVWGLSDLHLFEETHNVLKKQVKPFFAVVQTAGNHRPYNIPEDNRGFVAKKITKKEARDYGFQSSAEYNAFRYLDHSVGFFIQEAKKEKYFDNTIFVFFGDHGVNGSGIHMSPAQRQLHINSLNVPLIIYAPKHLKPEKHSFAASEVDVLPTLTSLAGLPYINRSLGSDLLDPKINKNRTVFTMAHSQPLLISSVGKNRMFSDNILNKQPTLHDLDSATPRIDISNSNPKETERLKRLTFGLYETIKYMRYHNQPE